MFASYSYVCAETIEFYQRENKEKGKLISKKLIISYQVKHIGYGCIVTFMNLK